MFNIFRQGSSLIITSNDNSQYPWKDGQMSIPLNSVNYIIDESEYITFRSSANNDILFTALINEIRINDNSVDKDSIISMFDNVANSAGNGGGGGGDATAGVNSINGFQGDLNIKSVNGKSLIGSGNIEIEIPKTDLSDYYKKSETYTKSEVNELIDGVSTGDVDLTNYYTKEQTYSKSEIDNLIPTDYITSIPSEYITETELNKSLSGYAKLTDIPTDYIKEIPSEYITESELNAKGYLTSIPSEYVTETELNDMNFATKSELPSEYDDTSIVNRITALETELTGVSEQITELNNMVV